jgi:hypothetical protein
VSLYSAQAKAIMLTIHVAALVAGILLGHWIFDVVAY